MAQAKLKPAAKIFIVLLLAGAGFGAYTLFFKGKGSSGPGEPTTASSQAQPASGAGTAAPGQPRSVYKIALSEWPGHMPMVVGNGGLHTQPGSAADAEGIKLQIVFIEDPVSKNAALQTGEVDFVWQVVDEMPINMPTYKRASVDARAFLQLDWSRGGDACVATREIKTVEGIRGRKAAMMMFSPDHTVFEFMINNSRLTPAEIDELRKNTQFSMDDPTFGRTLFAQGEVDVACLWEPDVSLALQQRPGSHRLFSTADATDLIADVLLAKQELLTGQPELAAKVARVWFAGVNKAVEDKQAAARLIASEVPRFRDELGMDGTAKAFGWVKWATLAENARFFGIEGGDHAFDRVYNQADTVWTKYPKAEIADRFAPAALRNAGVVQTIWDSQGQKPEVEQVAYNPSIAQTGQAVFTKPVTINFATGQSELDSESMHILNNQVLPQLQMARGMYVRVEGNTDSQGSAGANQVLSQQRAQAVVSYLAQKGVDARRLTAKGNGDSNPIASNKTADGRANNRRTDIVFISGGTQL